MQRKTCLIGVAAACIAAGSVSASVVEPKILFFEDFGPETTQNFEAFQGGGGVFVPGEPFQNRVPTEASYTIRDSVMTMGIDASNMAAEEGGFSFWFSGISWLDNFLEDAGTTDPSLIKLTARISGSDVGGAFRLKLEDERPNDESMGENFEYGVNGEIAAADEFVEIGGLLSELMTNEDPLDPGAVRPFSFEGAKKIQFQFRRETQTWGTDAGNELRADWIKLEVIPEPASAGLVLTGLAAILGRRRRA